MQDPCILHLYWCGITDVVGVYMLSHHSNHITLWFLLIFQFFSSKLKTISVGCQRNFSVLAFWMVLTYLISVDVRTHVTWPTGIKEHSGWCHTGNYYVWPAIVSLTYMSHWTYIYVVQETKVARALAMIRMLWGWPSDAWPFIGLRQTKKSCGVHV
jgi:hypothetical protein